MTSKPAPLESAMLPNDAGLDGMGTHSAGKGQAWKGCSRNRSTVTVSLSLTGRGKCTCCHNSDTRLGDAPTVASALLVLVLVCGLWVWPSSYGFRMKRLPADHRPIVTFVIRKKWVARSVTTLEGGREDRPYEDTLTDRARSRVAKAFMPLK